MRIFMGSDASKNLLLKQINRHNWDYIILQSGNARVAFPSTQPELYPTYELLKAGHSPYVPHLCLFWHFLSPLGYEDIMRVDMEFVVVCEALIRLPGISPGADREVRVAQQHGIPFFYSVATFLLAH